MRISLHGREDFCLEERACNSCYTYFKITGNFDPDDITKTLGLMPEKQWKIGDFRRNGSKYDFALWEYGRCNDYDVYVENQMMKTIEDLWSKVEILYKIRQMYEATFTLEIVPTIYAGGINPCLAPNKEIIKFCYETGTNMDIDLYIFDSAD